MKYSDNLISHRFAPINENLISSIVDGYIFFSSPDNFNDPYDCRISIGHSIENARAKVDEAQKKILNFYTEEILEKIMTRTREVGVTCFSDKITNTLMWSHYAKNHSGVALTYEIPPSFIMDNSPPIIGWSEVSYGNNLIEDFFASLSPDQTKPDFENYISPLLIKILSTKSPAWRYEREFRIVKAKPGCFNLDKKWLKQVCFGLATKDDKINLIAKLIAKHGYENVRFARMVRHNNHDFGFRPLKIKP